MKGNAAMPEQDAPIRSGLIRNIHPRAILYPVDKYAKWEDAQKHAIYETIRFCNV